MLIFFSGSFNLPLCLVTGEFVVTSELPKALVNVNELFESMNFTILVTSVPASFVNATWSPGLIAL